MPGRRRLADDGARRPPSRRRDDLVADVGARLIESGHEAIGGADAGHVIAGDLEDPGVANRGGESVLPRRRNELVPGHDQDGRRHVDARGPVVGREADDRPRGLQHRGGIAARQLALREVATLARRHAVQHSVDHPVAEELGATRAATTMPGKIALAMPRASATGNGWPSRTGRARGRGPGAGSSTAWRSARPSSSRRRSPTRCRARRRAA